LSRCSLIFFSERAAAVYMFTQNRLLTVLVSAVDVVTFANDCVARDDVIMFTLAGYFFIINIVTHSQFPRCMCFAQYYTFYRYTGIASKIIQKRIRIATQVQLVITQARVTDPITVTYPIGKTCN